MPPCGITETLSDVESVRAVHPYIEEELSHIEYQDLLDCGCGTGPMISLLHEKDSSKHYVGLDLTPKMIEVARNKNLEGTEWIVDRKSVV